MSLFFINNIWIFISSGPKPSLGGKRYYISFRVKNNLENDITIRTSLKTPHEIFHVQPSREASVDVIQFSTTPVYIQAVDRKTGAHITLNGKSSAIVTPTDKREQEKVFYAPDQCKLKLYTQISRFL